MSGKDYSVTLAIGRKQASNWRAEIFAEDVKTTLTPIGRCCEMLDLTFECTKHAAYLWCQKKKETSEQTHGTWVPPDELLHQQHTFRCITRSN
eukprot:4864066-Amphidinium_carterae.6